MSDRPNVFVVQANDASRDLSSAHDFGAIRYLLPAGIQPSLDPDRAMAEIREKLTGFKEGDFITSTGGDLAGVFMAGLILPDIYRGVNVNWLRWERAREEDGRRRRGFYVPSTIDLDKLS